MDQLPKITPDTTKIGWIGTGVMGSSMSGRLMDAGYTLFVNNRSRSKAESLLARGAQWCDSPYAVSEHCNVIFTMVGHPEDVRSVVLGDNGTLRGAKPGTILVDMSTSQPTLAIEIADAAAVKGVFSLDAPVSGSDVFAREGKLSIMIGGDKAAFLALSPCWQVLGRVCLHQGQAGAGQHTKLVNQILLAGTMIGICEALVYGHKAKLDLKQVLESVSGGAAGSWLLTNLAPRILANNFDPGFFIEHFIKDMGIVLNESRRMELSLPGLALVQQLYTAAAAQGHGRDGIQALQDTVAKLAGVDWKQRMQ